MQVGPGLARSPRVGRGLHVHDLAQTTLRAAGPVATESKGPAPSAIQPHGRSAPIREERCYLRGHCGSLGVAGRLDVPSASCPEGRLRGTLQQKQKAMTRGA
jgi:hypothetical protein